jgi:hypothetical protein
MSASFLKLLGLFSQKSNYTREPTPRSVLGFLRKDSRIQGVKGNKEFRGGGKHSVGIRFKEGNVIKIK